jgi:ubiquinone biosynthesis O-methyltransferase
VDQAQQIKQTIPQQQEQQKQKQEQETSETIKSSSSWWWDPLEWTDDDEFITTTTPTQEKEKDKEKEKEKGKEKDKESRREEGEEALVAATRLSESAKLKWWGPDGKTKPVVLHRMNGKRVAYIRMNLCKHFHLNPISSIPLAGLSILDVGCGQGLITEPLARLGGDVLGIDASPSHLAVAEKHRIGDPRLVHLTYRHATAEELVREGLQFDAVTCLEVIEHVAYPERFLDSLCKLVRPGGGLFIATINRTIKAYALAVIGAEYILRWVPRGTHKWTKFVQPTELGVLLSRRQMNVAELTGLAYNTWTGNWEFCTDLSVNYILWATKQKQ